MTDVTAMERIIELGLSQTMLIDRLITLAFEYHTKAITPEHFSERVYEMLYEHDREIRKNHRKDAI